MCLASSVIRIRLFLAVQNGSLHCLILQTGTYLTYLSTHCLVAQIVLPFPALCYSFSYLPIAENELQVTFTEKSLLEHCERRWIHLCIYVLFVCVFLWTIPFNVNCAGSTMIISQDFFNLVSSDWQHCCIEVINALGVNGR